MLQNYLHYPIEGILSGIVGQLMCSLEGQHEVSERVFGGIRMMERVEDDGGFGGEERRGSNRLFRAGGLRLKELVDVTDAVISVRVCAD